MIMDEGEILRDSPFVSKIKYGEKKWQFLPMFVYTKRRGERGQAFWETKKRSILFSVGKEETRGEETPGRKLHNIESREAKE